MALLPTYADTYGYFVLEAQSCGCPVITTDISALSEINNIDCGWVIPVPKDSFGNGVLNTEYERAEFSNCIYRGLEKYVLQVLDNPSLIKGKAMAAIERIRKQHDPLQHAEETEEITFLEETLKWGELSYITEIGSTLRMDWKPKSPNKKYYIFLLYLVFLHSQKNTLALILIANLHNLNH